MKVMALDYGEKRVGVASTDESGRFALPRAVFPNDEGLLNKVLAFKEEHQIASIVLGESRNLDGSANPILQDILAFKKALEEEGIEVILHPEVLTTREARQIQGNSAMTDASAAALILKNFLDSSR